MQPEEKAAIFYFGNDWFAENRTSSHQIARCLAKDYRVIYVECPGLRAPRGTGRDLGKIWKKLKRFCLGAQAVPEGLKVRTLLQIPLHRFAVVRWLNRRLILATLRALMWRERIRQPILWFMVPHLAAVAGRLGEQLSVYYCIDDYASLPGVNAGAVRAMDDELTRRADVVFVASATLLEAKKRLNPNTHVSPHGVELGHWCRALDPALPIPADIVDLHHPVIGFFGLIESWIDLDLMDFLARQRPQWTFLMIGRVAVPPEQVPKRANLRFLGVRPYEQLPAYGKEFDVAIIPYRLTQQALHANPIKLREYLAMGKPIVSVSTPEIEKYADVVGTAHSREDFLARLDRAVSQPLSREDACCRIKRVATESWDARLSRVCAIVEDNLSPDTRLQRCQPVQLPSLTQNGVT